MSILNADDTRLYTVAEAAEVLRCAESWLRGQVTQGLVPHVRLGKVKGLRFSAEDLAEIAESLRRPAKRGRPANQPTITPDTEPEAVEDLLSRFQGLRSLRAVS